MQVSGDGVLVVSLSPDTGYCGSSPCPGGQGRGVHGSGPHGGTRLSGEGATGRTGVLPGAGETEVSTSSRNSPSLSLRTVWHCLFFLSILVLTHFCLDVLLDTGNKCS